MISVVSFKQMINFSWNLEEEKNKKVFLDYYILKFHEQKVYQFRDIFIISPKKFREFVSI